MNLAVALPYLQAVASIGATAVIVFMSWQLWRTKDATIESKDQQIVLLRERSYERTAEVLAGMKATYEAELQLARNRQQPELVSQQIQALSMVDIVQAALEDQHAQGWDLAGRPGQPILAEERHRLRELLARRYAASSTQQADGGDRPAAPDRGR
jgi:hypothetical protein